MFVNYKKIGISIVPIQGVLLLLFMHFKVNHWASRHCNFVIFQSWTDIEGESFLLFLGFRCSWSDQ